LLFELYLVCVFSCTVLPVGNDWLWRPPPKWSRLCRDVC